MALVKSLSELGKGHSLHGQQQGMFHRLLHPLQAHPGHPSGHQVELQNVDEQVTGP